MFDQDRPIAPAGRETEILSEHRCRIFGGVRLTCFWRRRTEGAAVLGTVFGETGRGDRGGIVLDLVYGVATGKSAGGSDLLGIMRPRVEMPKTPG